MKTFKIEIQELLGRVIEVQANNFQEAFSKVYDQHRKGEIILGQNDLLEVNFKNIYKQRKMKFISYAMKLLNTCIKMN